jgi:anaerobic selenocysteine-containing dehydrogenase
MKKEWKVGSESDYTVRTCGWSPPGDHPVGCGMRLHIKDGRLVGVEGDEEHPITQGRLCVRCLTLPEYVHHPQRIIHPMRRVGKRGENKWEQISWDEALDVIADKAHELQGKHGLETVVTFVGTGRQATLYNNPLTMACFRSPNACFAMSGFACYGPRHSIAHYVCGTGYPEIDFAAYYPDRYDNPEFKPPKYIIVWGKNPLYSSPDGFFGHSLIDLMKRGTKLITVDPRVTWTAAHSEIHLQVRPGTDSALALGMLNVIINEDLYDHEFVEKWTLGFEELRQRVQEYPPERVEEITWVPKDKIIEAARKFATGKNSSILWGLAFDQTSTGGQAAHGVLALLAICNYIDVPGGNTVGMRTTFLGKWRFETQKWLEPGAFFEKRIGAQQWPAFSHSMNVVQPDELLETLETGKPYPLTFGWFQSSNLLAPTCNVQPDRWYNALQKLEFNVVTDLFMTPTASAFADIFLPLSTFAEHDGIVTPHFGRNMHFIGSINKAFTVGECKSDIEICIAVGKRLNPEAWPWDTAEEFFDAQLKASYPFGYDEFRERGVYQAGYNYKKYETGQLRDDGEPGFNTPTGLIELNSTLFPLFGEDPLPYFKEPHYSPYSTPELFKEYPLILTTGGRKITSFHSEHRQVPSLREIDPWPEAQMHPETAAALGISEGDWICIENMFGKAREKVTLTETIHPKVVHATHGWWYPEQDATEPNLFGVWKSNINTLLPHKCISKLGFGSIHKDMICKVYRVDGLEDNRGGK